MALPTGSGSESLMRVEGRIQNSTGGTAVLTVGTLKIVTILSITVCAVTADSLFQMALNNGTDRFFVKLKTLADPDTFVWNDRIVLHPADILKIFEHSNQPIDYWVSYIEQDWTD
jgi:hypothetical protein